MSERQPVLIIGLDGATFDVLRPLIEEDLLPNIAHFYHHGARGTLVSTIPPVTAPAWTSFATGLNPGRTGVFDFWNRRGEDWQMTPMDSSDLAGQAFWDLAGEDGSQVIIYNYPMLYPAYPVNGILVGGIGSSLDSQLTYPPELYDELVGLCKGYDVAVGYNNPRYTNRENRFVEDALRLLDVNARAISFLLEKKGWDVFICVLSATDFAQHYLWKYIDPSHREYDEAQSQVGQEGMRKIWQRVDGIVGSMANVCGDAADIIIMSDHGFGPEDQVFYINSWLEKHGFLVRQTRSPFVWRSYPWLRRLLRDTIARWFPALFEAIRKDLVEQIRFGSVIGQIDMPLTKAFGLGSTASGAIYINRSTGADSAYEQTRLEIREALHNLGAELGGEVHVEVHFREEIYTGSQVQFAPDIVFSVNDHRCTVVDAFSRGRIFEERCWSQNKSGSHRTRGVLMASGPRIRPGVLSDTSILDLAPTILYLMGVPIPSDLDGQMISQMVSEHYLREHPVRYSDRLLRPTMSDPVRKEEEAIAQRLRDLGYL